MAKKKNITANNSELQQFNNFVLFEAENGKVNIDVYFLDETLWLSQKSIAELFEKGRSTITGHLKKIFEEGELNEVSVCRDFRHTAEDGKTYTTQFYNLIT
ncbi:MAG: phosphoribosylaminoimidazolesuccinocarboxamide synthase [Saprospiraceae bacterium]